MLLIALSFFVDFCLTIPFKFVFDFLPNTIAIDSDEVKESVNFLHEFIFRWKILNWISIFVFSLVG